MEDDLLTIDDLAKRWGVSLGLAKSHVRLNGVPFLKVGPSLRINWSTVRFKRSAVARWEEDAQEVYQVEPRAKAGAKAATVGRYKYTKMR